MCSNSILGEADTVLVTSAAPEPWPTFPARAAGGQVLDYHLPPTRREDLEVLDLFTPLAMLPRWGGTWPVSILGHLALSVRLAYIETVRAELPATCQLWRYAAAHDLHEAVLLDLPRPLKALLPDYQRLEARWEAGVHQALGLTWPRPPDVEHAWRRVHGQATALEMVCIGHPEAQQICDVVGWGDEVPPELVSEAYKLLTVEHPTRLWGYVARPLQLSPGFPVCRQCGCTDESACPEGCTWVDEPTSSSKGPICSRCWSGP